MAEFMRQEDVGKVAVEGRELFLDLSIALAKEAIVLCGKADHDKTLAFARDAMVLHKYAVGAHRE